MKNTAKDTEKDTEKENSALYEQLYTYSQSDFYPFHMPGHKRQIRTFEDLFAIDITEIDGFDNLHHAESILLEAQQRAAQLYHAEETFYLVNGSTCGILSAVSASVRRGGKILMARNCHKAAYHAALLNDLQITYLYPQADMVRGINSAFMPEEVQGALALEPEISAVLITSPTYDGVVSDVRRIAEIVHEAGKILIVDEAHGAHFGMHPYFPEHSLACGADLVINSVHKTLPSLTQTALLHVQGERVDRERLKKYLGIYQSSSPSYVFMAGIDACVGLLQTQGEELFEQFAERLEQLRSMLRQMQVLHLVDGKEAELYCYDFDRSKILISTERSVLCGAELSQRLREKYHLEMEMEAEHYVTAIATIADTEEGLQRLGDALLEIDREMADGKEQAGSEQEATEGQEDNRQKGMSMSSRADDRPESMLERGNDRQERMSDQKPAWDWLRNEAVMNITAADDTDKECILLEESEGRISGEFVYLYPPGIPLLVPGERITKVLLAKLEQYRELGLKIQGLADYQAQEILVLHS